MKNIKEILSMNLKYYRNKYDLSQEKFAEIIGSNLVYINQLENCKRNPSIVMLDKICTNLNKYDSSLKLEAYELIQYDKSHITNYTRIDKKTTK